MKYGLLAFVTALFSLSLNPSKTQTASADNKISQTITFRPIPTGPSVLGVFEGRPPCQGIAGQLKIPTDMDCVKLKWNLTLFRDPVNFQPTTYTLSIVGGGELVKTEG